MAEIVKDFWAGMPWGMYLILIFAFLLIVASWIVPPIGVISSSALQGVALILGAAWLFYITCNIPTILANGAKIRASYGNAQIEIGRHKKEVIKEEENDKADTIEPWARSEHEGEEVS